MEALFHALCAVLAATDPWARQSPFKFVDPADQRIALYEGMHLTGAEANIQFYIERLTLLEPDGKTARGIFTECSVPLVNCFMPRMREILTEAGGMVIAKGQLFYPNGKLLAELDMISPRPGSISMRGLKILQPNGNEILVM